MYEKKCWTCRTVSEHLKNCSRCKLECYCDRSCQKESLESGINSVAMLLVKRMKDSNFYQKQAPMLPWNTKMNLKKYSGFYVETPKKWHRTWYSMDGKGTSFEHIVGDPSLENYYKNPCKNKVKIGGSTQILTRLSMMRWYTPMGRTASTLQLWRSHFQLWLHVWDARSGEWTEQTWIGNACNQIYESSSVIPPLEESGNSWKIRSIVLL